MIGREPELGELRRALDSLRPGTGGRVVVLEGPAGIGKTTLLQHLADDAAERGMEVLRCGGADVQGAVGFTALHELLHPLLPAVSTLPVRQARALLTALGETEDSRPDPLLIGLATLGLLEDAASARPVVAIVDDLHWIDRSSAGALEFVARRLTNAPVLVVAAVRPGVSYPALADDVGTVIPLGPLDDAHAQALVDLLAPGMSPRARRRLVAEASGNPLALSEFVAVLNAQGATDRTLPGRLPTSRRLEQAFIGDLTGLPPTSRELLLLAAAGDDPMPLSELLAAGRDLGATDADLAPLERSRLLTVSQDRLTFSHPLVRSTVYGAASTTQRAAAHRRLAAVTQDPARSTWHRAAATLGRDETVAGELEAVGHLARRRGALPEAVTALRRAAELSPDAADCVHRLAVAAEFAREAGMATEARTILDEVIPVAQTPSDVVLLAITEAMLRLTDGLPARSVDEVLAVAARLEGTTPADTLALRTRLVGLAVSRCWAIGGNDELKLRVRRAAAQLNSEEDGWLQRVCLSLADPVAQAPRIRPLLAEGYDAVLAAALVDGGERETGTSQLLHMMERVAESLQDLPTARRVCEDYLRFQRTGGAISDEGTALQARSMLRALEGDLAGALADAEQSVRLGFMTRSPRTAAASAAVAALVHALRGDISDAVGRVRDADELSNRQQHALVSSRARWAAGLVAMGEGRYADAWLELSEVASHPTTALWAVADLAEAGVRSGYAEAARTVVAEAERRAEAFQSPFVWAVVRRAQAFLAEGDEAEHLFVGSVEAADAAGAAFEQARSQLALGEWLRRRRRIIDARAPLQDARRVFLRVGAHGPAERASAELRAAGAASAIRPEPVEGLDLAALLTPQELQIVQLAASGMSNKEIADQVYLSHRTVGAHLYKAFPKLGVANRAQLANLLRGANADSSA